MHHFEKDENGNLQILGWFVPMRIDRSPFLGTAPDGRKLQVVFETTDELYDTLASLGFTKEKITHFEIKDVSWFVNFLREKDVLIAGSNGFDWYNHSKN